MIHLPPPPLPGHPTGVYHTVKRKGTVGNEEHEVNLVTLGGRPRSVEGLPVELRGARRRRHDVKEDYISVSKVRFMNGTIQLFYVVIIKTLTIFLTFR